MKNDFQWYKCKIQTNSGTRIVYGYYFSDKYPSDFSKEQIEQDIAEERLDNMNSGRIWTTLISLEEVPWDNFISTVNSSISRAINSQKTVKILLKQTLKKKKYDKLREVESYKDSTKRK